MKKFISPFAVCVASIACTGAASAAEPPVPPPAAVNAKPTSQAIGDWLVACASPVKGRKACVMSQTLVSEKLKATVSVLRIWKDPTGKLRGSLQLPVGVSLPAGVVVGLEDKEVFTVPYSACNRAGCVAPFEVTEAMLGQIRKAPKISAVVQRPAKQALNLAFSTRGFPDAYEAYLKESK